MVLVRLVVVSLMAGCLCTSGEASSAWVSGIRDFSSQYSTSRWSARQVIGKPDVYPNYGDLENAWAPFAIDANQFLELQFPDVLFVTSVDIYEVFNSGGVKAVKLLKSNNGWDMVWSTSSVTKRTVARILTVVVDPIRSYATNTVRLDIDCTAANDWVEIDAVQIKGAEIGTDTTATDTTRIGFETTTGYVYSETLPTETPSTETKKGQTNFTTVGNVPSTTPVAETVTGHTLTKPNTGQAEATISSPTLSDGQTIFTRTENMSSGTLAVSSTNMNDEASSIAASSSAQYHVTASYSASHPRSLSSGITYADDSTITDNYITTKRSSSNTSKTSTSYTLDKNITFVSSRASMIFPTKFPQLYLNQKSFQACSRCKIGGPRFNMDSIIASSKVTVSNLSSTKWKKSSAPDDRISSKAIGTFAIVLMSLIFGMIVVLDIRQGLFYFFSNVK